MLWYAVWHNIVTLLLATDWCCVSCSRRTMSNSHDMTFLKASLNLAGGSRWATCGGGLPASSVQCAYRKATSTHLSHRPSRVGPTQVNTRPNTAADQDSPWLWGVSLSDWCMELLWQSFMSYQQAKWSRLRGENQSETVLTNLGFRPSSGFIPHSYIFLWETNFHFFHRSVLIHKI